MPHIAVCICTYNRPSGLASLLQALDGLRLYGVPDDTVSVVVVDNSPERSAETVAARYAVDGRFASLYVSQPLKGLANARNAALDAATAQVDRIAFIDDDERPAPDWLDKLGRALDRTGAAAAVGPVDPVFDGPPPRWAARGGFYAKRLVPDHDGCVNDGSTANAMIACSAIKDADLRFDEAFNETGGEDTMFFRRLRQAGFRIAWAADAKVYEDISTRRTSLWWLLQRWYRTGQIEAHLGSTAQWRGTGRAVTGMRGLARLAGGSFLVGLAVIRAGWRDQSQVIARLYTVCRGAGLVANAVGHTYREYDRPDRR